MGEIKGAWQPVEDEALRKAVERAGDKNWMAVSREVNMALGYDRGGRTAKQCRGRYMHHLKPGLRRGPWTWDEEETLVAAHIHLGNSWSKIARELPGRTETDIKNHWNCTLRKKMPWDDAHRSPLQRYQLARGLSMGRATVTRGPNGPAPPPDRHGGAPMTVDDLAAAAMAAAAAGGGLDQGPGAAGFPFVPPSYPHEVLVAAHEAATELYESEGPDLAPDVAATLLSARGHPYQLALAAATLLQQQEQQQRAEEEAGGEDEEMGEGEEGEGAEGDDYGEAPDDGGARDGDDQGSRGAGGGRQLSAAAAAAAALAGLASSAPPAPLLGAPVGFGAGGAGMVSMAPLALLLNTPDVAAAAGLTPPAGAVPLALPLSLPLGCSAADPARVAAVPLLAALSVDAPPAEVLRSAAAALNALAEKAEGGGAADDGDGPARLALDFLRESLGVAPGAADARQPRASVNSLPLALQWQTSLPRTDGAAETASRKRRAASEAATPAPKRPAPNEGGAVVPEHPALVLPAMAGFVSQPPAQASEAASLPLPGGLPLLLQQRPPLAEADQPAAVQSGGGADADAAAAASGKALSGAEIRAAMAAALAGGDSDSDSEDEGEREGGDCGAPAGADGQVKSEGGGEDSGAAQPQLSQPGQQEEQRLEEAQQPPLPKQQGAHRPAPVLAPGDEGRERREQAREVSPPVRRDALAAAAPAAIAVGPVE
ncbi:hypothetical protein Rsub_13223 [Raphidocelis subcapitata]|uniref:Uncharacterized protein n=1 Tax=Raphidocelis subcapitata TaxID=307507 RepID=A0A2V0PKW8_9CHLO|nr:hypothetical protein Rsub_13223 [Raphidocelis subcapitata]|eukprot:GBG00445.1 hypothetical protein Rsub_13223 [Raphidocelis subcapitata]